MIRPQAARIGIAVVVAAAVAACGGGGGANQAGSADPTKAAFIRAVDDVCRKNNQRVESMSPPVRTDMARWATYVDTISPILQQSISEFKALKPPREDQATITRIITDTENAYQELLKAGSAAERNDAFAFETSFRQFEEYSRRSAQTAVEYGFKVCGSGS
jgi:hypothetical protein